ncbi:hypothetical protein CYMTET_26361, partial [Cymbomonas tetramitiformis]
MKMLGVQADLAKLTKDCAVLSDRLEAAKKADKANGFPTTTGPDEPAIQSDDDNAEMEDADESTPQAPRAQRVLDLAQQTLQQLMNEIGSTIGSALYPSEVKAAVEGRADVLKEVELQGLQKVKEAIPLSKLQKVCDEQTVSHKQYESLFGILTEAMQGVHGKSCKTNPMINSEVLFESLREMKSCLGFLEPQMHVDEGVHINFLKSVQYQIRTTRASDDIEEFGTHRALLSIDGYDISENRKVVACRMKALELGDDRKVVGVHSEKNVIPISMFYSGEEKHE